MTPIEAIAHAGRIRDRDREALGNALAGDHRIPYGRLPPEMERQVATAHLNFDGEAVVADALFGKGASELQFLYAGGEGKQHIEGEFIVPFRLTDLIAIPETLPERIVCLIVTAWLGAMIGICIGVCIQAGGAWL